MCRYSIRILAVSPPRWCTCGLSIRVHLRIRGLAPSDITKPVALLLGQAGMQSAHEAYRM